MRNADPRPRAGRHLALSIALALAIPLMPAPVLAETAGEDEAGEGRSLIEEGMRLFMRGLMAEMEPGLSEMWGALEEMHPLVEEWGPQMHEIIRMMGDIRNYEPPVTLPNGDILIRRRPAPEGAGPPVPEPDAEIEL